MDTIEYATFRCDTVEVENGLNFQQLNLSSKYLSSDTKKTSM